MIKPYLLISLFIFVGVFGNNASAAPVTTNFQAFIQKPDKTPLEASDVTFVFKYRNPADNCTVFIEQFTNINMVGSGGNVNLKMGKGTVIYPASGLEFNDLFDNASTNTMACQEGGNYTPISLMENRNVTIQFSYSGSNGTQSLGGVEIDAVPYAMYASKAVEAQTAVNFTGMLAGDVSGLQSGVVVNAIRGKNISPTAPTSGQVLVFNSAADRWEPTSVPNGTVTSVTSSNAYLTVANSTTTPSLTLNVGTAANTVAAGNDSRIVGAFQTSTALGGDLSGTLPNPTVATVGGKTAAEIAASVDDTQAATDAVVADTIVRRDASGNASFNNVTITGSSGVSSPTVTTTTLNATNVISTNSSSTNFSGRNFLFYDNTNTNKITMKAPNTFAADYVLTLPAVPGTAGYVLSTDGAGVTSWIPNTNGSMTNLTASAPLSSTGGATPTISISQSNTTTNGYLSSVDWNTFNNKQPAGNYITNLTGDVTATGPGSVVATISANAVTTAKINNLAVTDAKINDVAWGKITSKPTTVAGYGITDALTKTITNGNILIGDGLNLAAEHVVSGDATMSNTGILTLAASGATAGTYSNITVDAKGRVTSISALSNGNITTALGYTPVNRAGDTMAGDLNMGSFNLLNAGNITMATNKTLGLSNLTGAEQTTLVASLTLADKGKSWFNSTTNKIMFWDGTAVQSVGTASGSVASVTASAPLASSGGLNPNITIATANTTTTGALSSTDWNTFNNKQPAGSYLTSLTGDVVAAGPGAGAATIQANAITTAKINNLAVTDAKINDVAWGKITGKPTTVAGYGITDGMTKTLATGQVWFGDGSNLAAARNILVSDVKSSVAGNWFNVAGSCAAGQTLTYSSVSDQVSCQSYSITSSQVTTALGFTPVNKAGDTMTGTLNLPANGLVLGTNQLVASGGNVGVGTAAPAYKLDVAGDVNVTGNFKINGVNINNTNGTVTNVTSANSDISVATGTTTPVLTLNSGTAGGAGDANKIAKLSASGFIAAGMMPAHTGDVTSTAGSVALTLANSGVTAGTYTKITVDAKGRATVGASLASSDVTTALGFTPMSSAVTFSGDVSGTSSTTSVDKIKGTPVTITTLTSGNFLKYDGTAWVNVAPAISDITNLTTQLANKLDQSNMPATCSASQTLTFSSPTGTWTCSNIAGLDAGVITTGTIAAARLPASASYWSAATGGINYGSGNVGIGTTAPTHQLSLEQSSNTEPSATHPTISIKNTLATLGDGVTTFNYSTLRAVAGGGVDTRLRSTYDSVYSGGEVGTVSSYPFRIFINGPANEAMRIIPGGNVGIGTKTPAGKLQVNDSIIATSQASYFSIYDSQVNSTPTNITGGQSAQLILSQPAPTAASDGSYVGVVSDIYVPPTVSGMTGFITGGANQAIYEGTGALNTVNAVFNYAENISPTNITSVRGAESMIYHSSSGTVSNFYPVINRGFNYGTGTITYSAGSYNSLKNESTGIITTANGSVNIVTNASTGTIGTAYGINSQINNSNAGGNITTAYGVYLATSNSGTITNNYGIYQATAASKNYFAGSIGIGTSAPTYQLQLSTDSAAKPGTSTWTIASDERLKDIRAPFNRSINDLLKLNTIYFNYKKDNPLDLPSDKEYVGIRAQDAQKAIPESVSVDEQGYLHVTNDAIIWTVVNSVKELYMKWFKFNEENQRNIASVNSQLEQLKSDNLSKDQKIKNLESENKMIRSYICSKDPNAIICK